jgi:murein L,D-transpeptidase YafK
MSARREPGIEDRGVPMVLRYLVLAGVALALVACQDAGQQSTRHLSPIPPATMALMASKGLSKTDPILVRAYKKEAEMEVWKRGPDGQYALLKTFPICRWSGQLGPKVREGDRQAPEGFYTITPAQMNPNSSFYLSFDTGFPNAYDRANGRSGSYLMVHGNCSSRGCFAMTDESIAEIYAVAREAFAAGQRGFQFQSYPFRMTAENLAKYRQDPNMPFWKNLKEGSDIFEVTGQEPKVALCGRRYSFGATDIADGTCAPQLPAAVAQKRERDEQQVAELVAKGVAPVRLVYEDGGQHESFRSAMASVLPSSESAFPVLDTRPSHKFGDVSRPEALAMGAREVPLESPKALAAKPKAPATALAYAPAAPTQKIATAAPAKAAGAAPTKSAARAEPSAAEPAASPSLPSEDRPFYKRMLGGLLGSTEEAVAPEPAAPASAAVAPPRRPKVTGAPAKPQASAPAPDRRAEITLSARPN